MSFPSSVDKISVFLVNVSDISALEVGDAMLSSNQVSTQNSSPWGGERTPKLYTLLVWLIHYKNHIVNITVTRQIAFAFMHIQT